MLIRALRIGGGLLLTAAFLLGLGILFLNTGAGRDWLASRVASITGGELRIGGAVWIRPWSMSLHARQVSFAGVGIPHIDIAQLGVGLEAAWFLGGDGPLLSVDVAGVEALVEQRREDPAASPAPAMSSTAGTAVPLPVTAAGAATRLSLEAGGISIREVGDDIAIAFSLSAPAAAAGGAPWMSAATLSGNTTLSALRGDASGGATRLTMAGLFVDLPQAVEVLDGTQTPVGRSPTPLPSLQLEIVDGTVLPLERTFGEITLAASRAVIGPQSGISLALNGLIGDRPVGIRGTLLPETPGQSRRARVDLRVDFAGLGLSAEGVVEDFLALAGFDVQMNTSGIPQGITQLPIVFFGESFSGVLRGDWPNLVLEVGEANLATANGAFTLRGTLSQSEGQLRVDGGELTVASGSVDELLGDLGIDFTALEGPVAGRVAADGYLSQLELDGLRLSIAGESLRLKGKGFVRFGPAPALRIDVSAESGRLAEVIPELAAPNWTGGPARGAATLSWSDGLLAMRDAEIELSGAAGAVQAKGDLEDVPGLVTEGVRLVLAPSGAVPGQTRTALLSLPEGLDSPGQVELSAGTPFGVVEFSGAIDDPRNLRGISGDYVLTLPASVAAGGERRRLAGSVDVADFDAGSVAVDGALEGAAGSLSFRGTVEPGSRGLGRLEVTAMDPETLSALLGFEVGLAALLELRSVVAFEPGKVMLHDLAARVGDSDISGSVELSTVFPGPPDLHMRLTSGVLDLADFGLAADSDREFYFSAEPIPVDWIDRVSLNADVSVERLESNGVAYQDVQLGLVVSDRRLVADFQRFRLGGGDGSIQVDIENAASGTRARFAATVEGMDPGALMADAEDGADYSGEVDVEIEIAGGGASVREIMSTADGSFLFRINEATIPGGRIHLLSADFLFEIVRRINPFVKQSQTTHLECGLFGFVIRDGIASADKTIVLKGKNLMILGEGQIDLGTEQLKLVFRPKAQEGIGFNTSGLVKFIGVGGTLANPQPTANPKGLLMSGASLGAAVASGGMSLVLQNMFDRITAGRRECDRVEAAFRDRIATGESSSTTSSPSTPR